MEKEDIIDRINDFAELNQQGWDNDDANPVTEIAIEKAIELVDLNFKYFDDVYVFPMREGGVQFEYEEIEIEIGPDGVITCILFDKEYNVIYNEIVNETELETILKTLKNE